MTSEHRFAEDHEACLLVRTESLEHTKQRCRRMVEEVRLIDSIVELEANPPWPGTISTTLVKKGMKIGESRSTARSLGDRTWRDSDDLVQLESSSGPGNEYSGFHHVPLACNV
jgi:hypothetical protein